MGTFGDASGIVMVIPAFGQPGKILGLHDGELQAYLDSDGTLKWAAGKGTADATRISHTEDANNYWQIKPSSSIFMEVKSLGGPSYTTLQVSESNGRAFYALVTEGIAIQGVCTLGTAIVGDATTGVAVQGSATTGKGVIGIATGATGIGVYAGNKAGGTTLQIVGGIVDGGGQRYTAMGNASADTDGLNRITADGRYIGLPGSPEQGDVLFWNGSAWTRLVHGTAGDALISGGNAANPAWGDHDNLGGLADDDHTQYLLATGSRTGASAGAQTFTNGVNLSGSTLTLAAGVTIGSLAGYAVFDSTAGILFQASTSNVVVFESPNFRPATDLAINLGLSNYRYATVYGDSIYATTRVVAGAIGSPAGGRISVTGTNAEYLIVAYDSANSGGVSADISAPSDQGQLRLWTSGGAAGTLLNAYGDNYLLAYGGGNFGIGAITPATKLHTLLADSGTDAVVNVATIGHDTSGTAANGFGAGLALQLESSTTAAQAAARVVALWNDATHATRKADLVLYASDSAGEREGVRLRGNGSAAALGFLGAAPVVRQTGCAVPTTLSECITAIGALRTALNNLGLTTVV